MRIRHVSSLVTFYVLATCVGLHAQDAAYVVKAA